jgi:eukaryotic-like serine/threonine-protein kinase
METTFIETQPQFSPDGRWLAYMSSGSGQPEVYLRPFPGPGAPSQVSTAGGAWPRWRRDSKEIFYLALDGTLTAVSVDTAGSCLDVSPGRALFPARTRPVTRLDAYQYDVSADGQRFLVNTFVEESTSTMMTLVVNWPAALRK